MNAERFHEIRKAWISAAINYLECNGHALLDLTGETVEAIYRMAVKETMRGRLPPSMFAFIKLTPKKAPESAAQEDQNG